MSETRYKVPTKDYVDSNVEDLAGVSRTTETVYQNQQDILNLDSIKANKVGGAVVGNFASLNDSGDLVDSGRSENDFEFVNNKTTSFQATPDDIKYPTEKLVKDNIDNLQGQIDSNDTDISGLSSDKADKVGGATTGNFATLNDQGNLIDSGRSENDFEFVNNKTTSFQTIPNDTKYPTEKLVKDNIDNLQGQIDSNDTDISGLNSDINNLQGQIDSNDTDISDLSSDKADKVGGATTGNFAGLNANGNLIDSGDNSGSFTPASHVGTRGTSHDIATTTINGFMSSADKVRLNGMDDSANNYSLPTASAGTLGGVKIGSGVTISSGVISVSTNYQVPLSNVASGYDYVIKNGNVIRGLKGGTNVSLSLSSNVITITSTDTDTTYSAGTGLSLLGTTFSVVYGNTADTACEGNDSRLVQVEYATSTNTGSTLVKRDTNGSFHAQNITLDGILTEQSSDLAEYMYSDGLSGAGDVLLQTEKGVAKSFERASKRVVGVYSDSFGHILGGNDKEKKVPVGLAGQVHVKVRELLSIGDLLISDVDGFATKAVLDSDFNMSTIIGKVLENKSDSKISRIKTLIK